MAEVTGDLGGQLIQLNNAATEATLKQLLAAMLAQVAMQNKGTKKDNATQKELERELTRLAGSAKAVTKANDDLSKSAKKQYDDSVRDAAARKKAADLEQQQIKNLQLALAATNAFADGLERGITSLSRTISTFSNLNSSFTSAAASMESIPLVGGALAAVFGTVAQAGERTYKAFQQASSVGANFGGSINDMIDSAAAAGLTFDQFSAVIAKNGENIAMMGKAGEDGATRLGKLGKELRSDRFKSVNEDLARLGYTTEDMTGGMARYAGILAKTGHLEGKTNAELIQGSADYLRNMDALSKLTGKSKDALKAEQDALMADAAYRTRLATMDPKGAEQLNAMMLATPKHLQAGLKEIITFGSATTDAGRNYIMMANQSAGAANQAYAEIKRTGTLSAKTAENFYNVQKAEAKAIIASPTGELFANVGDSIQQGIIVSMHDLAAQSGTFAEITKKQQEAAAAAAAKKQEGMKDGLDPAQLQRFQTLIAEINNRLTKMAAQFMPQLESAFRKMADFVEAYVVPVFKFMLEYIEEVLVGLAVLKLAALAFKGYAAVMSMRGTTRSTPMFVEDVGGGSGGGGDGKRRRRRKSPNRRRSGPRTTTPPKPTLPPGPPVKPGVSVGTVAKAAGGVGAVVTTALLVNELGNINQSIKDGNITADQGTVQKSEAVGGAVGGTGGAVGGAWAGAGIGTLILPGVGTVIGGVLGGVLGGIIGDKAGRKAGTAVGEKLTEPKPVTETDPTVLREAATAQQASLEGSKALQDQLKEELRVKKEALALAIKANQQARFSADTQKAQRELDKEKREIEARLAANSKKIQEGLTTTTKALADAKKAELDAAKKAEAAAKEAEKKPELNFNSPQQLYDSFRNRRNGGAGVPQIAPPSGQPGSGTSSAIGTGLGAVAEKYESAGRGSGTVGWDKNGGTSYGKKQISSKAGAMTDYLKFLEKTGKGDIAKQLREAGIEKDTGSTSGKAVDVWKKLAAEGALGNSENEFIGQGYSQAKAGIKDKDLQARIDGSRALQEMLYSTAVQHGPSGAMAIMNSVFKKGMTDEQLVKAVYAERGANDGMKHFSKSKPNERAGVVARFGKEQQDILGLLGTPGTVSGSPTAAQSAATTPGTPAPVQVAATTPSAQTASSAITPTPTALAAVPTTEAQRVAQTQSVQIASANRPGTGAPGAGGGSPMNEVVAQLEMLNNKIASLIRINNDALNVGQNQLRAAREASGNLFMT